MLATLLRKSESDHHQGMEWQQSALLHAVLASLPEQSASVVNIRLPGSIEHETYRLANGPSGSVTEAVLPVERDTGPSLGKSMGKSKPYLAISGIPPSADVDFFANEASLSFHLLIDIAWHTASVCFDDCNHEAVQDGMPTVIDIHFPYLRRVGEFIVEQ